MLHINVMSYLCVPLPCIRRWGATGRSGLNAESQQPGDYNGDIKGVLNSLFPPVVIFYIYFLTPFFCLQQSF